MEISRRDFLRLLGVTATGATVGALGAGTVFSIPEHLFQRISDGPKIESWKTSVCSLCPGGCGIRVRLIDGIPVRITGNPLHPINRGAICPLAEAGIEMLYHPKRLKNPLKRSGARGENKWQEISWEEALQTVSERLNNLFRNNRNNAFHVFSQNYNNYQNYFLEEFMFSFGSENHHVENRIAQWALPVLASQGWNRVPAYDLLNSDCILNFGADVLDTEPSPVRYNQIYGALRNPGNNRRTDIIHFGAQLSRTAAMSSQWIPTRPGTMACLALSIAYIMIRDRSYDKGFVRNSTFGFKDWTDSEGITHKGFESLVTGNYYPERVSKICGVPAEKIVKTARRFAAAEKALAFGGEQAVNSPNGFYTSWAIYCLNALKGNLDKPGGVLFPSPVFEPPVSEKSPAYDFLKRNNFEEIIGNVLAKKPEVADTILFNRFNPVFNMPARKNWHQVLQNIPFIISYTSFIDDTSRFADLVLPAPFFLEDLDLYKTVPSIEFNHLTVQQPVVDPLYNTRGLGDILILLAKQTDLNDFKWKSYEQFVKSNAESIYLSGEGSIISESTDRSWIEFLKRRGWQPFAYSTFDEFWDVLLEKGGWWNPIYPDGNTKRIFRNKSGKFEFFSQTLYDYFSNDKGRAEEEFNLAFVPHYDPPAFLQENKVFPYSLIVFPQLSNYNGTGSRSGLVQELSAIYSREFWNSWVEIDPYTAGEFGLNDGDGIALISATGRIPVRVKIVPTLMPGVLAMPLGQGHEIPGEEKIGQNPMEIVDKEIDSVSGAYSLISTRVRIEKISSELS